MKTKILNLAVTVVIAGTLIISCQSKTDKVEDAQNDVQDTKEDLRVAEGNDHLISARVQDVAFFGGASTIILTIEDHPATILFSQPGATVIQRGSELRLTWDMKKAIVLPKDNLAESPTQ